MVEAGGSLREAELTETSGLAGSTAAASVLWAINDSGHGAVLYALGLDGSPLGRVEVDAANRDWEALDSGFVDGVGTLLIGETGDNLRSRPEGRVLLVTEPDVGVGRPLDQPSTPLAVRTVRFRYPDSGHDVESMALDDGVLWMLDKPALGPGSQRNASGIFRLVLDTDSSTVGTAERVGEFLAPAGGLAASLAASMFGVDLGYPTALDLDAERGHAWVLTYRDVLRYDRQGAESWALTLAREPASQQAHGLSQAEALAVTAEGLVVYTSEGRGAPLQVTGDR